jgi:hypothetical protein
MKIKTNEVVVYVCCPDDTVFPMRDPLDRGVGRAVVWTEGPDILDAKPWQISVRAEVSLNKKWGNDGDWRPASTFDLSNTIVEKALFELIFLEQEFQIARGLPVQEEFLFPYDDGREKRFLLAKWNRSTGEQSIVLFRQEGRERVQLGADVFARHRAIEACVNRMATARVRLERTIRVPHLSAHTIRTIVRDRCAKLSPMARLQRAFTGV